MPPRAQDLAPRPPPRRPDLPKSHARAKGPKRGRPTGTFTQHRRLDRLRELLEAHANGLVLEDIATMLRVTRRSVRRYLEELGRLTELESVPTTPGGAHVWRIKPSERGRALLLRRTQAYGLLSTRRVFDVLRGSALYDELDNVHRQLLVLAHRPTRAATRGEIPSDLRLEERLLYFPTPPRNYGSRGEELDVLFLAVANLHAVSFRPKEAPRGARVMLRPYALVLHDGGIAVLGEVEGGSGEVEAFLFERIADIAAHPEAHCVLPDGFDPKDYVHGELGLGAPGKKRVRVVVEFDPSAADLVRFRRVHPSQRLAAAPDGRVRLHLQVSDLAAVAAWVLRFGAGARVIEPEELALEVRASLERALARYPA